MNLPNKLTVSRVIAVLVIAVLYFVFKNPLWNMIVILSLFALASFTDFLDGKIARKYNLVTGFGKLMDPLADKLLVLIAIFILYDLGYMPYLWVIMIIISRELFVLGVRLVSIEGNSKAVIAADIFGKAKTMTQMVSIVILLFYGVLVTRIDPANLKVLYYIGIVLFYISTALTVYSGIEVFVKNKNNFKLK